MTMTREELKAKFEAHQAWRQERIEKRMAEIKSARPEIDFNTVDWSSQDMGDVTVFLSAYEKLEADYTGIRQSKTSLGYAREFAERRGDVLHVVEAASRLFEITTLFSDSVGVTEYTKRGERVKGRRHIRRFYETSKGKYFMQGRERVYFTTNEEPQAPQAEQAPEANEEQTDARLDNVYAVLARAGFEPQDHVTVTASAIQLIGGVDEARRMADELRAAGYAVEASKMFLGTYFIEKMGPVPTLPGDCPECGCKEAHAFNGPVVECKACGFQHLPGVPIAATLEQTDVVAKSKSLPAPRPPKIKDAGLMTLADVPLYVKEIIWSKMQAVPAPYYFSIKGTPGGGTTTIDSAYGAFDKLRHWCESIGAEVNMIRNGFRTENGYERTHKVSDARMIVEITDPASRFIEGILEAIHGKYWKISAPKDAYEWRYLKEQGRLPKWE